MSDISTSATRERRDSFCPTCENIGGTAVGLKCESGVQTATYECPSCGGIWEHAGLEGRPANWSGGNASGDEVDS